MPGEFTVSTNRFDPYKNFKFRVKWDGAYVAGVSKLSGLKRTTAVIELQEGGDPSNIYRSPGPTKFQPVTLERGLTQDTAFADWANQVWQLGAAPQNPPVEFRKDILIDVFNEADQLIIRYKVFRCWVSEYQALADLDSNANAVAIEHITLENEGWERDLSVQELPQI
jgi:phage tail-like protein